jgi:hypothetical protein
MILADIAIIAERVSMATRLNQLHKKVCKRKYNYIWSINATHTGRLINFNEELEDCAKSRFLENLMKSLKERKIFLFSLETQKY